MTGDAGVVSLSYQELAEQVTVLGAVLAGRDRLIAELSGRITVLETQLAKNSQNSSKPPSTDVFVKPPPRSLRQSSGRKPGKQPGEKGSRLERRADPDEIIVHVPSACSSCGSDLGGAPVLGQQTRQVFDLPPIMLRTVEHQAQRRVCSCGTVTVALFPAEATAPTCYGPGVAALGAYLLGRQHLPVDRAAEMMADCFGAPVSTGWLASLLPTAAGKLDGFLTSTRTGLQGAEVAHFDETGGRVAGKLKWIHVACTKSLTLYHLASGRGKDSIDAGGVLPHFTGVAIHDGLTSYRKYPVEHGLCAAHHLRELAGMAEATGQGWPTELADLLVEMHVAVQTSKAEGNTALPTQKLAAYRRRYQKLVDDGQRQNPPPPRTGKRGRPALGPVGALLRRLDVYADDVLRFATDFRVEFTNNQAEQDVRMVKLQQKISGGWRSPVGADAFLAVRSYLSTARKQGQGALEVLWAVFTGNPWMPATSTP